MPSLPGLAPRLARASPKIAELLLQVRAAARVSERKMRVSSRATD
jgi:hypothetical protein